MSVKVLVFADGAQMPQEATFSMMPGKGDRIVLDSSKPDLEVLRVVHYADDAETEVGGVRLTAKSVVHAKSVVPNDHRP